MRFISFKYSNAVNNIQFTKHSIEVWNPEANCMKFIHLWRHGAHVWIIIIWDSALKPNNNNSRQLFSCQISFSACACIPSISWGACCESALKTNARVHQAGNSPK